MENFKSFFRCFYSSVLKGFIRRAKNSAVLKKYVWVFLKRNSVIFSVIQSIYYKPNASESKLANVEYENSSKSVKEIYSLLKSLKNESLK